MNGEENLPKPEDKGNWAVRARFLAEVQRTSNPTSLADLASLTLKELGQTGNINSEARNAFADVPFGQMDEFVEYMASVGFEAAIDAAKRVEKNSPSTNPFSTLVGQVEGMSRATELGRNGVLGVLFAGAIGSDIIVGEQTNPYLLDRVTLSIGLRPDQEDEYLKLLQAAPKVMTATVADKIQLGDVREALATCIGETQELCKNRSLFSLPNPKKR